MSRLDGHLNGLRNRLKELSEEHQQRSKDLLNLSGAALESARLTLVSISEEMASIQRDIRSLERRIIKETKRAQIGPIELKREEDWIIISFSLHDVYARLEFHVPIYILKDLIK